MGCKSSAERVDPGLIEGQRYWISSKSVPGKVLGCAGKGTTNGTKIVLWEKLECCPDQEWTVKKLATKGTFLIGPSHCKLQMEVPLLGMAAHLGEPSQGEPNKNQVFAVLPVENEPGWFCIERPEGKLTLDVSEDDSKASDGSGTAIIAWSDRNNGPNQKLAFTPIPTLDTNATYQISSKCAPTKVFGCAGGDAANGTKIVLWEKDGTPNQTWKAHHHGGAVYSFAPGHALGKRMDNPAVCEQNHLLDAVADNPNQLWTLEDAGAGYYFLKATGNRVLDIKESKDENGAVVYTWNDFHKGPNQQFQFTKI